MFCRFAQSSLNLGGVYEAAKLSITFLSIDPSAFKVIIKLNYHVGINLSIISKSNPSETIIQYLRFSL